MPLAGFVEPTNHVKSSGRVTEQLRPSAFSPLTQLRAHEGLNGTHGAPSTRPQPSYYQRSPHVPEVARQSVKVKPTEDPRYRFTEQHALSPPSHVLPLVKSDRPYGNHAKSLQYQGKPPHLSSIEQPALSPPNRMPPLAKSDEPPPVLFANGYHSRDSGLPKPRPRTAPNSRHKSSASRDPRIGARVESQAPHDVPLLPIPDFVSSRKVTTHSDTVHMGALQLSQKRNVKDVQPSQTNQKSVPLGFKSATQLSGSQTSQGLLTSTHSSMTPQKPHLRSHISLQPDVDTEVDFSGNPHSETSSHALTDSGTQVKASSLASSRQVSPDSSGSSVYHSAEPEDNEPEPQDSASAVSGITIM